MRFKGCEAEQAGGNSGNPEEDRGLPDGRATDVGMKEGLCELSRRCWEWGAGPVFGEWGFSPWKNTGCGIRSVRGRR